MATTTKISAMAAATTPLVGADFFPAVQSGVNTKPTIAELYTNISVPVSILQLAIATGVPRAFGVTGGALTNLTLSTEVSDVVFDLSHTVEWATGALAAQSAMRILAPTYAFVGASTIAEAATLCIDAAPAAGANATIDDAYALWIASGDIKLGIGQKIILDDDKDSYIFAVADDNIRFVVNNGVTFQVGVGAVKVTGNAQPNSDSTFDLGTTSIRWREAFVDAITLTDNINIGGDINHDGTNVGFYATAPIAQQTGVAVSDAAIHAALVALGLITA